MDRTLTFGVTAALALLALRPVHALTLRAPAAQELASAGPEGPLANDTFLPLSAKAAVELGAGDRALGAARAGGPEAARELARALEAWRAALDVARPDELVPAVALDAGAQASPPRFAEDVVEALERRLDALTPAERAAWVARFGPLAEQALARARAADDAHSAHASELDLARVCASNPGTPAAARAALTLFDRALEEGRPLVARGWLERVERTAAQAGLEWEGPLRTRRVALSFLTLRVENRGSWEQARTLEPARWLSFPDLRRRPAAASRESLGRRLRPGAVRLADGALAVQTVDRLFVLDEEGGIVALGLGQLLESFGWPYQPPFGDPEGDWPLTPASDGTALVLVVGRSTFGGGNALVCLTPPEVGRAAEVRWALSSIGERRPGERAVAEPEEAEDALEEGQWSFQPGPLVAGDVVLVQARHWPGGNAGRRSEARSRSWLLALDLETGRPRWKRFLCLGADRADEGSGAISVRRGFDTPAQPLARVGTRIFAPTGMGVAALVDLVDGRVRWAFKSRRHDPGARGLESSGPPLVAADPSAPGSELVAGSQLIIWGPGDSDHVYRLAARPAGADPAALLIGRPEPVGRALELYAADLEHEVALARAGARLGLARRTPASGGELDLLLFGREERPLGSPLASTERLLVATDRGLYLLDRDRDLFLLDQESLPEGSGSGGGSLIAHGERVWLVTSAGVWSLLARP